MDLNALYFHHQTAIMNGARTGQSQFDLVAHYAKRIRAERSRLGSLGSLANGFGGHLPAGRSA